MINKYDPAAIGKQICKERKQANISQESMVEMLRDKGVPISRQTLSAIEHGQNCAALTLSLLTAMCDIFDCEMGYLLHEHGYENRTRQVTDIVNATGLSQAAVNKLVAWNTPAHYQDGNYETSVKLKANEKKLQGLSALVTDPACMNALIGYLYRPATIETVYTHDDKGTHFSHDPAMVVMDNITVDSALIDQALLNTVNDSLKAIKQTLS